MRRAVVAACLAFYQPTFLSFACLLVSRSFPPLFPPQQRLLDYIKPDYVHIMEAGRITTTGGMELVDTLESGGYAMLKTA